MGIMNNTSFPQHDFKPFQSGMGMCNPSTDYSGSKGGSNKTKKSRKLSKGGNPSRYFNPKSQMNGGGRTSVCNTDCTGDSAADTSKFVDSSNHFSSVRKNQAHHAVEILGGGSDWSMSQRSRSLQPIEFSWTDLADFHAFTKSPYISPRSIVKSIMPPSAAQPTTTPDGFDPMGASQGAIGGGIIDMFFGKKKKATKKKAGKKKAVKKKAVKKKAVKKKATNKKAVKKKAVKKKAVKKKLPIKTV